MSVDAFAIFEGGGAKGIAHIGALRACEERGLQFKGVAGASAGAIVAALLAVGYSSKELLDPEAANPENSIFDLDWMRFLDEKGWKRFDRALQAVKRMSGMGPVSTVLRLNWFAIRHQWVIRQLRTYQGVFRTADFEDFLEEKLEAKLVARDDSFKQNHREFRSKRTPHCPRVRFRHIELPLKIVATDVSRRRLLVFSKEATPNYYVSKAVAASINLPFFFAPQTVDVRNMLAKADSGIIQAIDGGLLSNFPVWLFDAERLKAGPLAPTFGFRLVETKSGKVSMKEADGALVRFVKGVIGTVLTGDPLLETRQIENLHEVPLNVTADTLEFAMTRQRKNEVFNEGYGSASAYLDKPGLPRDPTVVREGLATVVMGLRKLFDLPDSVLIRANLICQTTKKTLRVTYSYGMDSRDDTDDQLEFSIGSGACSKCWTSQETVICDLVEAESDFDSRWGMNKYQQALVRKDLKVLFCHPILGKEPSPDGSLPTLAILNLDSTSASLYDVFRSDEMGRFVEKVALEIGALMLEAQLIGG